MKPERWNDPTKKIFPYQVGFTAPPHDFDAAPHDFLKIAPEGVGGHGRLIHAEDYGPPALSTCGQLSQARRGRALHVQPTPVPMWWAR